ncbi:MAG: SDR family oxidoreductase [Alphaproteobacteria bacterium]|nr:SDR family oxidoreductase [Alphaproteobacteria bacterium]
MRVLFIGGTGIISSAVTALAAARGLDLTLMRRGQHFADPPDGVRTITADVSDGTAADQALAGQSFDAVVDWRAYTPSDIEQDLRLFRGRTGQFVFISSASAYQKPVRHYLITESTPLANPYWQYARDKIACEERLMQAWRDEGFPVTIVRPSLTYGDTQIVLAVNSWQKSYTAVERMRRGRKVIVPGDGTSLWVITHAGDFAVGLLGLLGHAQAIGQAFHITSDEVMSWDEYYRLTAEAAGVEAKVVHIPSDFIGACLPDEVGSLTGDKSVSVVFDNSKIRRFVPDYRARVPFAEGIRRTMAWFDAEPQRRQIDHAADAAYDKLIDAYEGGLAQALRVFRP